MPMATTPKMETVMERLMTILYFGKQPPRIPFLSAPQKITDLPVVALQIMPMAWRTFPVEVQPKTAESSQILWRPEPISILLNPVKLVQQPHHVDGVQTVQKQNIATWVEQVWQRQLPLVQLHCCSNI